MTGLSDFQKLVAETLGHSVPLFGSHLFVADTRAVTSVVPALPDYVMGAGDEVVVKAWGGIDIDYKATVSPEGSIYLPKVGNIHVSGSKFSEVYGLVNTEVRKTFRNFELAVSMGQARAVEVFVVGQVVSPGTYRLPAHATALQALSLAQGPTPTGTMRLVQVRRNNKIVATLDLYALVSKGDRTGDIQMLPGDVLFVPVASAQVALDGAVTTPGIFEVMPGETLDDLIALSGGYSVTAKTNALSIEHIDSATFSRSISQVDGAHTSVIKAGDIIRVPQVVNNFTNAVTLRGAVAHAGRLPLVQGAKISDVITSREMLIEPAYWTTHNIAIEHRAEGDSSLLGGVRRGYEEVNWDYAVVERLDPTTLQTALIPFNLGAALVKGSTDDLELKGGDILTVFSKQDIKVPVAKQARLIRVQGEVNSPGLTGRNPRIPCKQSSSRREDLHPRHICMAQNYLDSLPVRTSKNGWGRQ
jgi:protein involved in polysaccharide export with SLBB domain